MATTSRKKGLGRGLDVLLNPKDKPAEVVEVDNNKNALQELSIELLQAGEYQPRKQIDESSLIELADSIKQQGIIQPILVREIKNNNGASYEIIAGERRFRAAKMVGLTKIPVVIKQIDDKASAAIALIENIQREDLNVLEEAYGMRRLIDEFGLTHEQLAKSLGKSRSAISNLLRLIQLTEPVQTMLKAGDIDMGHARSLLALSAVDQVVLAENIVEKQWSVRETEAAVKRILTTKNTLKEINKPTAVSEQVEAFVTELERYLELPVEVKVLKKSSKNQSGKLMIKFSSLDDLAGIINKLNKEK